MTGRQTSFVIELEHWVGYTPEQLEAMKDALADLRARGDRSDRHLLGPVQPADLRPAPTLNTRDRQRWVNIHLDQRQDSGGADVRLRGRGPRCPMESVGRRLSRVVEHLITNRL